MYKKLLIMAVIHLFTTPMWAVIPITIITSNIKSWIIIDQYFY
jgi:hypothetical protein